MAKVVRVENNAPLILKWHGAPHFYIGYRGAHYQCHLFIFHALVPGKYQKLPCGLH